MSGATQASGLSLEEAITFETRVPLAALRASGSLHPSQSHRYLTGEDLRKVAEAPPVTRATLQSALDDLTPA
ncbi:hypothetical protein WBG99_07940 [Streptomyces sp. TG1A-60]|uniref:hypothetical protein n=1 Tax=Streptomyces sp. TG1A-60 TaxID=3129111 RepID=UPI0030CC7203